MGGFRSQSDGSGDSSVGARHKPGFELVQGFATVGDLVLLLFGHLSVCLTLVFESWVPSYVDGKISNAS